MATSNNIRASEDDSTWLICVDEFFLNILGENTKFHRDGIFFFTSSHSVGRYQMRKYPYCHISNTPLFSGVLRCDSRGISAARMELGMDFFLQRMVWCTPTWDRFVTYRTPAPAPPLVFFVPTATYDDLVTSPEESHNTTPTGKIGKNTATMVAEPPSSPATWS